MHLALVIQHLQAVVIQMVLARNKNRRYTGKMKIMNQKLINHKYFATLSHQLLADVIRQSLQVLLERIMERLTLEAEAICRNN